MTPNTETFEKIVRFIRDTYGCPDAFIPLHEPRFIGREREYVAECIDSTFVSSVGKFVDRFEADISKYTGSGYAVATGNGTSALYIALGLAGVKAEDEVITQSLTFVATSNTIKYYKAHPLYLDVDRATMGLSPELVQSFLEKNAELKKDGHCYNRSTGRRISACVPVHVYGFPCDVPALVEICDRYNIAVVEDSAEAMGSRRGGRHPGTFGKLGIISFNGNKIITCGGGGVVLTSDETLAKKAKHLTTQAKVPHPWFFEHDATGYNFRMPNINAALACAQLEKRDEFLANKRELAQTYKDFFDSIGVTFMTEPPGARANYWLNVILMDSKEQRDGFLDYSNSNGVMTRPAWHLMHTLDMYKDEYHGAMDNSQYLFDRLVNIPSSARV